MKSINSALLEAQKNIGAATKGTANPFFKSSYADLATVMEVVKEPLNSAGLSITQEVGFTSYGDSLVDTLTTTIRGEDGQSISSMARIPPTKDIQKFGAAISYMKRYALQALLFVPTEDDDGNSVTGKKVTARPKAAANINNVPF